MGLCNERDKLASGSFGTVYRCKYKNTKNSINNICTNMSSIEKLEENKCDPGVRNSNYATKKFNTDDFERRRKDWYSEILAVKKLLCSNIPNKEKYYSIPNDVCTDDNMNHYIQMGFDGHDLFYICNEYDRTNEILNTKIHNNLHSYLIHMFQAIVLLHVNNFVHIDLKEENIFFNEHTVNSIKLGDFGYLKYITPNSNVTNLSGTPEFMPPKLFYTKNRRFFLKKKKVIITKPIYIYNICCLDVYAMGKVLEGLCKSWILDNNPKLKTFILTEMIPRMNPNILNKTTDIITSVSCLGLLYNFDNKIDQFYQWIKNNIN